MQTTHLFLGSIGVLAETSDIQRRLQRRPLRGRCALGMESRHVPITSLDERRAGSPSHARRATNTELSDATIVEIHRRKTEIACAEVVATPVELRPGVADVIAHALDNGIRLGLVTSTYLPNIEAIAEAAGSQLPLDRFDVVVSAPTWPAESRPQMPTSTPSTPRAPIPPPRSRSRTRRRRPSLPEALASARLSFLVASPTTRSSWVPTPSFQHSRSRPCSALCRSPPEQRATLPLRWRLGSPHGRHRHRSPRRRNAGPTSGRNSTTRSSPAGCAPAAPGV